MTAEIVLTAHRAAKPPLTLVVDDDESVADALCGEAGAVFLSRARLDASELWALRVERPLGLIVISAERNARELLRTLALAEHLVAPGGQIMILPQVSGAGEKRVEAVDVFCASYPAWSRRMVGLCIALQKEEAVEGALVFAPASLGDGLVLSAAALGEVVAARRVISLSVFGRTAGRWGGYWAYLPAFIRAHHACFPGWSLVIHHDDALDEQPYGKALRALAERGLVKLVRMAADGLAEGKCRSMLWRMAPVWMDSECEYVFARDLDALPCWRERCASEQFIASGINLHTIHDNPAHDGVMGGLCGVRAAALREVYPDFAAFIADAGFAVEKWSEHGADQDFLNQKIAPRLRIFEHSIFAPEVGAAKRKPSPWTERFETSVADFDDPLVPVEVREKSSGLIAYCGVAGYPLDAALEFYGTEAHCPRLSEIRLSEIRAAEEQG